MILQETIKIFAEWLPEGVFFIWAEHKDSSFIYYPPLERTTDLKFHLFAKHRPSFYGSFIDIMHHDDRTGIKLSPCTALDFFSQTTYTELPDWQWSEVIIKLREIAPTIKDALAKGQWRPDYSKWQENKTGWKLDWPENFDAEEFPFYLDDWVNCIINELIEKNSAIKEAWEKITGTFPVLAPAQSRTGHFAGEEDWLEAIGWRTDTNPFRTCLQLVEPEDEEISWKLKIILQDKTDENIMPEYPVDGNITGLEIPHDWQPHLGRVDRDLKKCLQIVPWLKEEDGASNTAEESLMLRRELSEDEAWEFLTSGSIELAGAGLTVFLPRWWEEVQKLKPTLKVKTRSSVGSWGEGWLGADRLVHFDWKLAVGDMELSEDDFQRMAAKKQRLMQIRGKWIQLDPALVKKVQKIIKKKQDLSLTEVLQMHFLSGSYAPVEGPEAQAMAEDAVKMEVELNGQLSQMVEQLTGFSAHTAEETFPAFQGKLRPYQKTGSSWLLYLRRFGLGGCLADDMGLGKTIQWIAYLLKTREEEKPATPALLTCPTSVLGNWQKELARFAPGLKVYLHYGPQRQKGDDFLPSLTGVDLVITSYNLSHLDEEELSTVEWDCICLDEAQHIKNAYTKQASAIRRLPGKHRVALTGTPMENRLTELWSIMDFLNPRYLGSLREFNRRFVSVIERKKDSDTIMQVQRLIKPFLLRRVKSDPAIELDLPKKQELKEYVPLTAEQASLYENTLQDMFERLENADGMARRGVILSTLTKLKQLCDHPALLLKEDHPADIKERSHKIERLLEMVEKLRLEGESCLIFTQFIGMGHLLQHFLQEKLQERVLFLHGGTPKARRDDMVALFQNPAASKQEGSHILILSLKAGGLGLNLTAANHVFHFDRWWNPAVENQATDRSHRIGQKRHVQVHKFISLGTLEERIDEMIESKQNLNEQIVGSGETWITELSTGELREIFTLRRDWISS